MKILYVEDELRQHKHRIKSLFEPILTRKIIRSFENLLIESDTDSAGIQSLLNSSNVLVVAKSFPEALEYVTKHLEEFALFIVDRNLSETKLSDFKRIIAVHPEYPESFYEKFFEREGDYLLEYLINKGINCAERFYMLTANSDCLRNEEYIQEKIHFKAFCSENIIRKDDLDNELRLRKIMLGEFSQIRKCHEEQLTNILSELKRHLAMKREDIRGNLGKLRTVIVELLDDINSIDKLCFYAGRNRPTERIKISSLSGNKHTAFIKPYCDYIYTIASETSTHPFDDENFPTIHTLNSAVSAMKDIFKWLALELEKND